VRAWVVILVIPQSAFVPRQAEEGKDVVEYASPHDAGAKTTVVFSVVNEQRRPRSAHRRQLRVILAIPKIGRVLLHVVADVLGMLDSRFQSAETGHRHGYGHPLVERAERDRLPTATRKAGHPE